MKTDDEDEEFFIGWQAKQPARMRQTTVRVVILLAGLAAVAAILFGRAQRAPDLAFYEWTNIQTFEGIVRMAPHPHLLVARENSGGFSAFPLVGPTKFGIAPEWCGNLDGKAVRIQGGTIHRSGGTMIEVTSEAPEALPDDRALPELRAPIDLGEHSLVDEIVDAKCYHGAMNPGRFKPHRACATVCVSGGIPPMLVVDGVDGQSIALLLVGSHSEMLNSSVLPLLARPVRIEGRVTDDNGLLILRARTESIRPL